MGPIRRREQGSDRCPDGIDHLSLERAHDVGYLQRVVVALASSVTADAARNATPSR
jgi:hypothetical protein